MWDVLACPFDRSTLDAGDTWLSCPDCGRGFPVIDGVPTFVCRADDTQLCGPARREVPALRLHGRGGQPRSRAWERLIARFTTYDSRARLLQLGPCRGGLEDFELGDRYGVDPRAVRGALSLRWIAACAHDLPFRDGTFDAVLVAPSQAADAPRQALLDEAARCLAPQGVLCVALEPAWQAGRRLVEQAALCGLHLTWSCAANAAARAYLFRRAACYSPPQSAGILAGKLRLVA